HSQNIQTAVKDVGGAVEMKCSVFNASGVPVAWIKFDKEEPTKTSVLSIGKKLIVRNPRFSVEVGVGNSSYTYKIQNIRDTDVASYRCVVMCDVDDGINTSADIELEVNRSPSILKLSSSPATLIAREGRPSKLECYADGYPEPKVTWSRQFNGFLTTGGKFYRGNVLLFPNVIKDDRGTYFCDAVNSDGKGVRHMVDFRVTFAPVIKVSNIMYTHRELSKPNMDVQCLVEAYPAPKIDWLYNGVVLFNDKYNRIEGNTTDHQFSFSSLSFFKYNDDQHGKYTCKAQNEIGTAEVTVIERPCTQSICDPRRVHHKNLPNFYGLTP
ncbi:lachesin-like, partial [Melanaphis sacchari]|uniref:lachesin-like n=1 Tax=Melanaphis sacchari TaxID=742174 RepID=UPI000DC14508